MAVRKEDRCQYGETQCPRKAEHTTSKGVAACGPCFWQSKIAGSAIHNKGKLEKGTISPLQMIPADWPEKVCGCGCGEKITRPRGFKPGHDARLKGAARRAAGLL